MTLTNCALVWTLALQGTERAVDQHPMELVGLVRAEAGALGDAGSLDHRAGVHELITPAAGRDAAAVAKAA